MKSTKYFISVVTVYFLYSEEIASFERCTEAATSALGATLLLKTASFTKSKDNSYKALDVRKGGKSLTVEKTAAGSSSA